MTTLLSSLPISIQSKIQQTDFKELRNVCYTHEYARHFEILIQGIDLYGRSCCKIISYPKNSDEINFK